jgi:hypothetical protein
VYQVFVSPLKKTTEVLTTVSATIPKNFVVSMAWITPSGDRGMSGTLLAGVVAEGRFLTNSSVATATIARRRRPTSAVSTIARITAPDKSVIDISMFDDGNHRDGAANDGIFGTPITFDQGGGYVISVIANVMVGDSRETVEKSIGYFQSRVKDNDLDGILDAWERLYFPDTEPKMIHPYFDHDADGLNAVEEHRYRTHPWRYDTDGDGRPDGAEVDAGTDPLSEDPLQTSDTDTDGDGIDDTWERRYFPDKEPPEVDASDDPDRDGLENYTEWRLGTDPTKQDTNGDGINDRIESSLKTPEPATRTWHPQPSEYKKPGIISWWLLLIFLLLLLLILLVIWTVAILR